MSGAGIDLVALAGAPQAAAEAGRILRSCVHCGFCLPACPTYLLLGDERDSPRGRIQLIGAMLRRRGPPDAATVRHIDRCLSCLSCMSACPSGVDYGRLVDHARAHIRRSYRRAPLDALARRLIAWATPHPARLAPALAAARLAAPLQRLLPRRLRPFVAMGEALRRRPPPAPAPAAAGPRRMRVALLAGCAQRLLAPQVDAAATRLLTRLGCEVRIAGGCCGALHLHMGERERAEAAARANLAAWRADGPFDAIVASASACAAQLKGYGDLLAGDGARRRQAGEAAALARDVCELADRLPLEAAAPAGAPAIACHLPCSLQHGQRLGPLPGRLLRRAGFEVREVAEGHVCCGAAGAYSLLQPALAERLRRRKDAHLRATGAGAVAAANVGCMVQLARARTLPVLHPVELLDWATGGPAPPALGAAGANG